MAEFVLDFEQPIKDLEAQIAKMRPKDGEEANEVIAKEIAGMERKLEKIRTEVYANLTGWQKVQVSRHPDRPYTSTTWKTCLPTLLSYTATGLVLTIKP